MAVQNEQDQKNNEQVAKIIDALTTASAALEKAAQYANESGIKMAFSTRDWCDDRAVEVRMEAEHVRRMLKS